MPDDLTKFLSDPSHQKDREFLDGYFENFLARKEKAAKEKTDEERRNNPPNIFDRIFGGAGK